MSRSRKLVHGVGVNDADYLVQRFEINKEGRKSSGAYKNKLIWACPFYRCWESMLGRCYSENYQNKKPTYKGCSVCQVWLIFSNFKSWMERQDWEGKQLDKDILINGNKIYSPQNCIFVCGAINTFTTESNASRGDSPLGVSYNKCNGKFRARCRNPFTNKSDHLGYFDCPEKAHQKWLTKKLEHAYALAAIQTDSRVGEALIRRYTLYSTTED